MAAGAPPQPLAVSAFPLPPDYAEQYTNENIAKKAVLPPPPAPTEFTVFGAECNFDEDVIRSLQSQKMQQLYSGSGNWRDELKKLNRSTVAAFLDLLDILIRCPNHPERHEKLQNLRLLFINMHHLINEYRPIQARDTLKAIMRAQIDSINDVTSRLRDILNTGRQVLNESNDDIPRFTETVDIDPSLISDIGTSRFEESGQMMRNFAQEAAKRKEARFTPEERWEALKMDVAFCDYIDRHDASIVPTK